jgi:PAS domain S-box-containing protein
MTINDREVYLETLVDIRERKQAQIELQRLSTAIEQSPETVMITALDGTIQYVNPAFTTITGYSREEVLGRDPNLLNSGCHNKAFFSNFWKTIATGNVWSGRFVNRRKNGELYTEEGTVSPVRNTFGAIIGYVATKRDITQELVKEDHLRQSQKMQAIGQLAGGIAHDFNNILQAILGFSEILLMRIEKENLNHRNVTEIQKAALRAADLTRQLLTFSRKQTGKTQTVNLNDTLSDSQSLIKMLAGEKIRCVFNLAPELQPVRIDPGQIMQIIMNLSANARDAMSGKGQLIFSTENSTFTPENLPATPNARPGQFICLSVIDIGKGMSQEVLNHLFEPFFTTKMVGEGTGLGLSVVYGIVQQSKGWIQVESETGKGTAFRIYLPVCELNSPADHEHKNPETLP